jgi:hypothetical protein
VVNYCCFWSIAKIVDTEVQADLSSALKRTAELSLVRVTMAASDPKRKLGGSLRVNFLISFGHRLTFSDVVIHDSSDWDFALASDRPLEELPAAFRGNF